MSDDRYAIKPKKPGAVNVNISIEQTSAVVCKKCNHNVFTPGYIFRKVSAIISPSGKEELVPIQIFECAACGEILEDTMPEELLNKM